MRPYMLKFPCLKTCKTSLGEKLGEAQDLWMNIRYQSQKSNQWNPNTPNTTAVINPEKRATALASDMAIRDDKNYLATDNSEPHDYCMRTVSLY